MIELGFFLYGDYYGKEDPKEGHIEIAKRILAKRPAWLQHFRENGKYRDPVDYLIFTKGAVKIGNRWGNKVITYDSKFLDKEIDTCLCEYRSHGWKDEDVRFLGWKKPLAVARGFWYKKICSVTIDVKQKVFT